MRQRWRNGRFVAALLAGLIALVALAWTQRTWRTQRQQARLKQIEYEPPPPGMVFVPAGEFLMGSDDAESEPDEQPLRKVFVPAFFIDKHEVTNRQFKKFKRNHTYPEGEDDFPVTFVLKKDAEDFCKWYGKRLPTSAEWEKAARGTDGRRYPWGNQFKAEGGNVQLDPSQTRCVLMPVGSFPAGASPFGAEDMSGNVWEWVADEWTDRDLFGLGGERRAILRGGAHGYSPFQARTSYQGFEAMDSTCHDVGFRCAMDAKPKNPESRRDSFPAN